METPKNKPESVSFSATRQLHPPLVPGTSELLEPICPPVPPPELELEELDVAPVPPATPLPQSGNGAWWQPSFGSHESTVTVVVTAVEGSSGSTNSVRTSARDAGIVTLAATRLEAVNAADRGSARIVSARVRVVARNR